MNKDLISGSVKNLYSSRLFYTHETSWEERSKHLLKAVVENNALKL